VIKKTALLILALVFVQCILSAGAAAQSPTNCLGITIWYFPDPVPPGWFVYSPYGQGPYSYYIAAMTAACAPAAAQTETCPTCPKASNPISLATGNTYIEQTDLRIPGLGGGLSLTRTWNSLWPATQIASSVGLFGPNWRSNFEEKIFMGSDNYLKNTREGMGLFGRLG